MTIGKPGAFIMGNLVDRLRAKTLVREGETVMLDMGNGPLPVSTGSTYQVRNPDGEEAANVIEKLEQALVQIAEGERNDSCNSCFDHVQIASEALSLLRGDGK